MSSQLRHVSTIGKKLVKQQYVLHMSPQYGELRPTSGRDRLTSLGYPCKFQLVSSLGSITAWHPVGLVGISQTAALNTGHHLYSAWRSSRWASVHILVSDSYAIVDKISTSAARGETHLRQLSDVILSILFWTNVLSLELMQLF